MRTTSTADTVLCLSPARKGRIMSLAREIERSAALLDIFLAKERIDAIVRPTYGGRV
jgi:hypothetical protein